MSLLFSIAYLPPLEYLKKCSETDSVIIESNEHFVKQSYRNRCYIAGPNGKLSLVIPVVHNDLAIVPVSQVKMSFESQWNKIHWKSITSAYRNSPFFEYYEDEFKEVYMNPPEKLFDFNILLLEKIFSIFNIKSSIDLTKKYEKEIGVNDLRNSFHPKKITHSEPYHQVFADRNGFISNLSAIDYLFNVGNRLDQVD